MHEMMPPRPHDIEAEVYALSTAEGGRQNPMLPGYRPCHDFGKNGELNDGMHEYPDTGRIEPGKSGRVFIWLLSAERNEGLLNVGDYLIGGGDDETAVATCSARDGQCHIKFRYRDQIIEEGAGDYFEALCRVRLRLEAEKLIPFCYGASLNVYPSGMCRDMGAGMSAYRMTVGKHANPKRDLVKIFEQGPDVIPASGALQKEYFTDWLKSKKS